MLSALQRFLMLKRSLNKLEISYQFKGEMLRYPWPYPAGSPPPRPGVLKDTNFALVSTAPGRLHCYILEKAQLGLLKPVLTQSYQVFLSYIMYILTAELSKTLSSAVITLKKQKKKWNHWVLWWRRPEHPSPLCRSFSLPRSCRCSGKRSTQRLNHNVLHFCPPHVSSQTHRWLPAGGEFKAIILSMWKLSARCLEFVPCVLPLFACFFVLMLVLFWSFQSRWST